MSANEDEVLLKKEVHRIAGCAMKVSNVLGHEATTCKGVFSPRLRSEGTAIPFP